MSPHGWLHKCWIAGAATLVLLSLRPARGAESAQPGMSFFEEKIRPVLVESCYKCHSEKATKIKGGLRLDSKELAFKGGDNGVAIVPGKPDESPLMKAIRRVDPET